MASTRLFRVFCNQYPPLAPIVTNFNYHIIKAHDKKIHWKFLRDCKAEHVIPASFLPNRLDHLKDKPFSELQRVVLDYHIEETRREKQEFFKRAKFHRNVFYNNIPQQWYDSMLSFVYRNLRNHCRNLTTKLKNKLKTLINNSEWTTAANSECVINLSSYNLEDNMKHGLGFGLSFAASNFKINPTEITKGFCNLQKYGTVDDNNVNICKGMVYKSLTTADYVSCPRRYIDSYNKLKKQKDIHITKADKSNAIVIIDKLDYVSKMNDLLSDDNTYIKLNKDPLSQVKRQHNKTIDRIFSFSKDLKIKFKPITPRLPYMYGLVKTHKPNHPMRPIISTRNSCSYNLSKWLANILTPFVGTISNSHIRNNVDLIDRLKNVNIDYSFKLVSFDVKSLFTVVPLLDLFEFMEDEFKEYVFPVSLSDLIELIKLCVCNSKFTFNDCFYEQKYGLAMGSCLSPVCSNLYMEFFEKNILSTILPDYVFWIRYVDDVLCLWPDSLNLDNFLVRLNSLVPSIKFSVEYEENGKLPFLDVLITRNINNDFSFDVYRKPTNISSFIHYYSDHPINVKVATFTSMFLRAFRVCSDNELLLNEIDNIYNISSKHRYPSYFIDKAYTKALKTFQYGNIREQNRFTNILVLPYHFCFNNLVNIFKKYFSINIVFKSSSTVKNILISNTPCNRNSCVYKIPCIDCNSCYVGQTGVGLPQRVMQHKGYVRQADDRKSVFKHIQDHNHRIGFDQASIIKYTNTLINRNLIESATISFYSDNLFNIHPGFYSLDAFIVHKIVKFHRINV